jgi:hypothetical protein
MIIDDPSNKGLSLIAVISAEEVERFSAGRLSFPNACFPRRQRQRGMIARRQLCLDLAFKHWYILKKMTEK